MLVALSGSILDDDDGRGLAAHPLLPAGYARSRHASFIAPIRDRVDKRLIFLGALTRRYGERLAVGVPLEGGRTHVGHPNLNGPQSFRTQPFAIIACFYS